MLILAILGFGMVVGALAQFILGREGRGIDWGMALGAGIAGSFIGGLLISLIAGDGLKIRVSGIIGSLSGAVIATAIWRGIKNKNASTTANTNAHTSKRTTAKKTR